MSDECLITKEQRFSYCYVCQAVTRKFTLAGKALALRVNYEISSSAAHIEKDLDLRSRLLTMITSTSVTTRDSLGAERSKETFYMSIFFGAKKRTKRNIIHSFLRPCGSKRHSRVFIIHSLAQRTNQETSTLTKPSPILEGLTRKSQKPTTS